MKYLVALLASATFFLAAPFVSADTGGPDAFGYTFIDSDEPAGPAFDWTDISGTGTPLGLSDDSFFYPVNLPFDF